MKYRTPVSRLGTLSPRNNSLSVDNFSRLSSNRISMRDILMPRLNIVHDHRPVNPHRSVERYFWMAAGVFVALVPVYKRNICPSFISIIQTSGIHDTERLDETRKYLRLWNGSYGLLRQIQGYLFGLRRVLRPDRNLSTFKRVESARGDCITSNDTDFLVMKHEVSALLQRYSSFIAEGKTVNEKLKF